MRATSTSVPGDCKICCHGSAPESVLTKVNPPMPNLHRNALLATGLAVGWMALIFALSSVPGTASPVDGDPAMFAWLPANVQNMLHAPVFGMLAWLWQRAFRQFGVSASFGAVAAVVITISYGAVDEWHQSFVPGRMPSLTDLSLDAVGACLAVLIGNQGHKWALARGRGTD